MNPPTTKKTSLNLIGAALLLSSFATASLPPAAENGPANAVTSYNQTVSVQMTKANVGATIIDSSDHPNDLSPVADSITTKVKEALAANQKVILMLGEIHGVMTHVRLAEMVRGSLHQAGLENPIMAQEANYRFLESSLSDFFPGQRNADFRARATQALAMLKEQDAARYHRIQSTALAAANWDFAPVTRLENLSSWVDQRLDIRLIDLAKTTDGFIDIQDPATGAFVDANSSPRIISKAHIQTSSDPEGIRLRNLWMAKNLLKLVKESTNPVVILQIGLNHLAGNHAVGFSYESSLHHALSDMAGKDVKILTVFPETKSLSFDALASKSATKAMGNADMTILRGLDPAGHWPAKGSAEEEIKALAEISHESNTKGAAPTVRHHDAFHTLKNGFAGRLQSEIDAITHQYAP